MVRQRVREITQVWKEISRSTIVRPFRVMNGPKQVHGPPRCFFLRVCVALSMTLYQIHLSVSERTTYTILYSLEFFLLDIVCPAVTGHKRLHHEFAGHVSMDN